MAPAARAVLTMRKRGGNTQFLEPFHRKILRFLAALDPPFILHLDAPRLLRSSPSPHRVFTARRRDPDEGADAKSDGIRNAGGRDYRSREPLRRDRILPGSEEGRN